MKHYFVIAALAVGIVGAALAEPICSVENIFAPQDKHVHGSSVVQCPNGDLLTCWTTAPSNQLVHVITISPL